jgi:adenylate cyclase
VLAHATSLLVHQPQPEPENVREDAMASIRRALELAPDDGLVHHCHAAVLANLGKTNDAGRAWERAVELDPNNAGARAGLGIGKIFQGRAEDSLEWIDGALRRSPADPLQYHWLGSRALALALLGRVTEAIEDAHASIQRKPSRLAFWVLAGTLAFENRLEEAGQAWLEVEQRSDALVVEDFARRAGALAPDPVLGKAMEQALCRAAEAANGAREANR